MVNKMILIDLNQVVISNLMVQFGKKNVGEELSDGLIRHIILNNILSIKKKFSEDYGNVVICCDNKNFWRKDVFEFYKGNRKKTREKSDYDWNMIFNTINSMKIELRENFPYRVIEVDRTEADDIIGVLTKEYCDKDKIMIISSDKDFKQLQRYPNVAQYSPILKKYIVSDDPEGYLREHIVRGDSGDGIPNILSDDDVFLVDGKRQKPISKKKLAEWLDLNRAPEEFCDSNMLYKYNRNTKLVDLTCVPEDIEKEILEQFDNGPQGNMSKVLNYFIQNKMVLLMDEISNFKEENYEISA
jgi:hypothetical protein